MKKAAGQGEGESAQQVFKGKESFFSLHRKNHFSFFRQKLFHRFFAGQPCTGKGYVFFPLAVIGKFVEPGMVPADLAETGRSHFQNEPAEPFFIQKMAVSLIVQPEAGAAFVAGGDPCAEFIAQRTGGMSVFAGSVFINIDFPFLAAGVAAFVRLTGKGGEEGREMVIIGKLLGSKWVSCPAG